MIKIIIIITNRLMRSRILLISLLLIIIVGCKSSNNKIAIALDKMALNCDTNSNERGRIVFMLKINNLTSNPIIIAEPDSIKDTLQSKFLLISDKLYPGALKLTIHSDENQNIIKSGEQGIVRLHLEYSQLSSSIRKDNSTEKVSFSDVKSFLNNHSYSIIYIKFKEAKSYFVSSSNLLKCSCNID